MCFLCREGPETPTQSPGPVVFVLKSTPHPVFTRRGYDLVHKATIPLYQALVGGAIVVKTLDSRHVSISIHCTIYVTHCPCIGAHSDEGAALLLRTCRPAVVAGCVAWRLGRRH